jgi:hypothetical protein
MIILSLLIAACFTLVSPQLALAQHTALMELYNALGLSTVTEKESKEQKSNFFCSGCLQCPRFAATAPCFGTHLACSGGNVTGL